jgi:hypothetical protein
MSDRAGMDLAESGDIRDVKTAEVFLSRSPLPVLRRNFPSFETVRVAIHSPEFGVSVHRRDRSWSALDAP